ncbi:PE family protein [Mycolicibacterium sp. GF69]|uniref:PE family protein n=1 Tax=Mycolicibacterium sp. GF69 TaxID=2267251 RepID=UPI000DCBB587|nr:PE family protein [Mycolicibacterium sp. GF69]RAV08225.1 PE family protein [Mycolicibacterium sp. GF69]
MQPLMHNPGAVGVGGQVVANGARGLAGGTTAGAAVTALVPAGADEVSAQAAAAFAAEGVETLAMNTFAQEELARMGAAVIEISGTYAAIDSANAATF